MLTNFCKLIQKAKEDHPFLYAYTHRKQKKREEVFFLHSKSEMLTGAALNKFIDCN